MVLGPVLSFKETLMFIQIKEKWCTMIDASFQEEIMNSGIKKLVIIINYFTKTWILNAS